MLIQEIDEKLHVFTLKVFRGIFYLVLYNTRDVWCCGFNGLFSLCLAINAFASPVSLWIEIHCFVLSRAYTTCLIHTLSSRNLPMLNGT
jgi:hypothetical protein